MTSNPYPGCCSLISKLSICIVKNGDNTPRCFTLFCNMNYEVIGFKTVPGDTCWLPNITVN